MSVQTPGVSDVAGYAAAVRRALVGLGPEQVEDLTDGLEADLAEAMADESTAGRGADPVARFGTPEEYATELGAAAGLGPVPTTRKRRGLPDDVRHPIRALRWFGAQLLELLRGRLWWPPLERFCVALRPVWWVLRGWVVYQLPRQVVGATHRVLPHGMLQWLLLAVLVVASVQWGRGSWRTSRSWRWLPMAASTVAAIAALPLTVVVVEGSTQYVYETGSAAPVGYAMPPDGVWVDGMQVSNLFVYDAAGNPLSDVQVYDDRGRPVVATGDQGQAQWNLPGVASPWSFVGVPDRDGRLHWNVYPQRGAPSDQFQWDDRTGLQTLATGVAPQDPPRPFAKAPAIVVPSAPAAPDEQATPTGPATPTGQATIDAPAGTPSDPATGATAAAPGVAPTP